MLSNTDDIYIHEVIQRGRIHELEEVAILVDAFPHGDDGWQHWITRAIQVGAVATVDWMIGQGVDLTIRESDGYIILHTILECEPPLRYDLLALLLARGAPVNLHGINDWTPLHMAAACEDISAMEMLIAAGADVQRRTRIDSYATPLEEARILGRWESVRFLERFG